MAVYIDDTGGWSFDALLNGVEDTAWSRDAANNLLWFSGTGTSTTGFTLPSATAWIVYEVYEPDSHTNDLTDGTVVYGHIEYTSTIGVIATTLETWKTNYENNVTSFTTYKIKATHYKTGDVADVYYATEAATDFSKAVADGVEDGAFTGYGAWSISNTMLSEGVSSFTGYDMYINFDDGTNDPSGITTNPIGLVAMTDAPSDYLDSDGDTTGISTPSGYVNNLNCVYFNGNSTYASCFHTDTDFSVRGIANGQGVTRGFQIILPEGMFDIKVFSSLNSTGTNRVGTFSLWSAWELTDNEDAQFDTFTIDASTNNTGTHCDTFTDVTGGRRIKFTHHGASSTWSYLESMVITKTADVTYGSEMLTGGGSTSDGDEPTTANWTSMGSNNATSYNTIGGVDYIVPYPKTANEGDYQAITTVVGKHYQVRGRFIGADDGGAETHTDKNGIRVFDGTAPIGTDSAIAVSDRISGTTEVDLVCNFIAESTTTSIAMTSVYSWREIYCSFMSCREIIES